jgi:hypothetical protein
MVSFNMTRAFFNVATLMVFFSLTMVFFNVTTLVVFFNPTMVFFNPTTLMVFFNLTSTLMVFLNPTTLMVFFNMTNLVLFFNTHHSTAMNPYGELVSPFLLLGRYSYGECVSPLLIKSKFLWRDCVSIPYPIKMLMGRSCLHSLLNLNSYGEIVSPFLIESTSPVIFHEDDSSFTEGSVNLDIPLVLFPVLFICFQMSLHVDRLIIYLLSIILTQRIWTYLLLKWDIWRISFFCKLLSEDLFSRELSSLHCGLLPIQSNFYNIKLNSQF